MNRKEEYINVIMKMISKLDSKPFKYYEVEEGGLKKIYKSYKIKNRKIGTTYVNTVSSGDMPEVVDYITVDPIKFIETWYGHFITEFNKYGHLVKLIWDDETLRRYRMVYFDIETTSIGIEKYLHLVRALNEYLQAEASGGESDV